MVKEGWTLRVLARASNRLGNLKDLPIKAVWGSLEDRKALRHLVENADVVVHCAGAVRGATPRDFDRVNVDGVRHMASAAACQDPPPRFLLMSSLAAREPSLSCYASSKRRGEEVLKETAAGKMPLVIFRPPAVYGPGDRELLPLFRWVTRGIGLRLGRPEARFSLLFIDDLVEAVLAWVGRSEADNHILELNDGASNGYTWDQVFDMIAALYGIRVRRVQVPAAVLYTLAQVNCRLARLFGFAPMLSPGKVRELRHLDWMCDNGRVNTVLGWMPRILIKEGLRRTLTPYGSRVLPVS